MRQLSPLDASFYYFESYRTPMHIGGIYIFESSNPDQAFNYEAFKDYMSSYLHRFPVFRQRLVEVPLDLGTPYWIDDPDFEIEHHIEHVALPKPANEQALLDLAARIFSKPLDKNRPLWEVYIVDGLKVEGIPEGAFAFIPKMHHAAVDGKSGVALMSALFTSSPEATIIPKPKPYVPERIPSDIELLIRNLGSSIEAPFKVAQLIGKTIENTIKSSQQKTGASKKNEKTVKPPSMFSAPKTIFNSSITPHRVVAGASLSLERVKAIKNTVKNTTVNDVILCLCAGALRQYLLDKRELPEKSLIAMAPISVRSVNDKGETLGNKISAMLVDLATKESDTYKRLQLINNSTRGSKVQRKAVKAEKLMDYVPSQLEALAIRTYTRMRISELHPPIYNLVITNVPGPSRPLYMHGAKLLKIIGMAPLIDGMGLMVTIFSYNRQLFIGATSCREFMPDVQKFTKYINKELEKLENIVFDKKGGKNKEQEATKTKVNQENHPTSTKEGKQQMI